MSQRPRAASEGSLPALTGRPVFDQPGEGDTELPRSPGSGACPSGGPGSGVRLRLGAWLPGHFVSRGGTCLQQRWLSVPCSRPSCVLSTHSAPADPTWNPASPCGGGSHSRPLRPLPGARAGGSGSEEAPAEGVSAGEELGPGGSYLHSPRGSLPTCAPASGRVVRS